MRRIKTAQAINEVESGGESTMCPLSIAKVSSVSQTNAN